MGNQHISLIAGFVSSTIFASSYVPMLLKALRTKDLRSYSLTNLVLTSVGNGVHWLYIVQLPFGPIWFLHGFYTAVTAVMFVAYLRYAAPFRYASRANPNLPDHPPEPYAHRALTCRRWRFPGAIRARLNRRRAVVTRHRARV